MTTMIDTPLNEQQQLMLRLLKEPLPDSEFQKVRSFIVRLLATQLDEDLREWEEKNNISESDYIKMSEGHFRSKSK